ncbi:hypothetical protein COC69_08010 [Bacillus cereus]|uniref:Uncharacterized protein n=1 Tax=Bacillus cereus TaxID=1396 RepID=A0A9X7CPW5_BACCE|nr:hypothetical protein [Bacillus cereus]PGS80714.1 hypothetical protein COC69_08010 [Bacillus cereus]
MDRISYQSVKVVGYLLFKVVEKFEIDEQSVFSFALKTSNEFENMVVEEVQSLLEQIRYMCIELEESEPLQETGELLENIKGILVEELSTIGSIEKEEYIERLIRIVDVKTMGDAVPLFRQIIENARERKKYGDKLLENPSKYFSELGNVFKEVIDIYEQANGEPEIKSLITCPLCEKQTNSYACAWGINKHVQFYCEHCGMNGRQ